MKTCPLVILNVLAALGSVLAQPVPTVISRGPHQKVWAWEVERILPNGGTIRQSRGFVQLGTGICRWSDGQWIDAGEVIEAFPRGAVARSAQLQVIFAPNLNTFGAIDTLAPDGRRLQTHILGLAFYDLATGRSAMVAPIKDCVGEVIPPNAVIYRDAFDGGFSGDVLYTYRLASFHQDVVLRAQLPVRPEDVGLSSETCVLEIWSEMVTATEPGLGPQVPVAFLPTGAGAGAPAVALMDQTIDFGSTRMVAGRGFALGNGTTIDSFAQEPLHVGKSWVVTPDTGRRFLVEAVSYVPLRDRLAADLPQAKAGPAIERAAAGPQRRFPSPPLQAKADLPAKPMQMAAIRSEPGFVIDYEQLLVNTNDFVFRSDTTYYVSNAVVLAGTTRFEGNTVIKNADGTTVGRLQIQGPIECETSEYRPAIFTAKDDDSVGEYLTGISTSNPTNYYGKYLDLSSNTNAVDLHDFRVFRAYWGITLGSGSCLLRNAQLSSNHAAIAYGSTNHLRNVLIHDGTYAVGGAPRIEGEHVTFHRVSKLRNSSYTSYLTNCLIVSVTNFTNYSGAGNAILLSDIGIFQSIGAGDHYLADTSTYRDAGTANIDPTLAGELNERTTYPPIVLTNEITHDVVFSPVVYRDTDTKDLGFHYAAVDYVVNSVAITNGATVTIRPGTAIAAFGPMAFSLKDCPEVSCLGEPLKRIQLTRYNSVQEQPILWGGGSGFTFFNPDHGTNEAAVMRFRFTDFQILQTIWDSDHLYTGFDYENGSDLNAVSVRDCGFFGGRIDMNSSGTGWGFTNNLLDRVWWIAYDGSEFYCFNNLHRGGVFDLWNNGGAGWTFRDNVFYETTLYGSDGTYDHNGYINQTSFFPTNSTDRILGSFAFEIGPLGNYYQPTNSAFTNAGSCTADTAGLFSFTTATSQVPETNSPVDIGEHYVAVTNVGGIWMPVDTDGDGVPDCLEDVNGDGTVNSGESDPSSASDAGLKVQITRPRDKSTVL